MTDDQKNKMHAVMAAAFDEAATKCTTMESAATLILFRLRQRGFEVGIRNVTPLTGER
mgnify:CR=1 FL=1